MSIDWAPSILDHFRDDDPDTPLSAAALNALVGSLRPNRTHATQTVAGVLYAVAKVSPGWIFWAGEDIEVGETDVLCPDGTTTSIWYADAGVSSGSAYPSTDHVRLGTVTVSGGVITGTTDDRQAYVGDRINFNPPPFVGVPAPGATSYFVVPRRCAFLHWGAGAGTAPGGGAAVFDIEDGAGASIFSDPADRPQIATGQNYSEFDGSWVGAYGSGYPILAPGIYRVVADTVNAAANIALGLWFRV